jgi:hypothetical protein
MFLTLLKGPAAPTTDTKAFIKVSGVWKEAIVHTKVSGTWKVATPKIKISGAWK